MSGEANVAEETSITNSNATGTGSAELSSSPLGDPNEGMYMLCGVLIAMLFVAVIIVLLAVTISKLRKREDSSVNNNNNQTNNNNNQQLNNGLVEREVRPAAPVTSPNNTPLDPPPFLWRYSNGTSQLGLCNNDQLQSSIIIPTEETCECKGFRKNLRGKWRRLVKKKQTQEVYAIPAEYRDQLKQIYVY